MQFIVYVFCERDRVADYHYINIRTGSLHEHVSNIASNKVTAHAISVGKIADVIEELWYVLR